MQYAPVKPALASLELTDVRAAVTEMRRLYWQHRDAGEDPDAYRTCLRLLGSDIYPRPFQIVRRAAGNG